MAKKNLKPKSGLLMSDSIHIYSNKNLTENYLLRFLIAFLMAVGTLYSVLSSFNFNVNDFQMITTIAAVIGIFTLCSWKKKLAKYLIPAFFVFILIFLWLERYEVYVGSQIIYNSVIDISLIKYTGVLPKVLVESNLTDTVPEECFKIAINYISVLVSILISLGTVIFTNFIFIILGTLPLLCAGFFIGQAPVKIPYIIVLSCWLAALAMHIASYKVRVKKSTSHYVKESKNSRWFYPSTNEPGSIISRIGAVTLAAVLISYGISSFYMSAAGLDNQKSVQLFHDKAEDFILNISWENMISKLSAGSGKKVKLGNVSEIKYANKTDLIANLHYSDSTIYLRGYSGGEYAGNGWEGIPEEYYENYKDAFDKIKSTGYYPQNFIYNYSIYKQRLYDSQKSSKLKIKNIAADSRYVYGIYGANYSGNDNFDFVDDAYVYSGNLNEYSLDYYNYCTKEETLDLVKHNSYRHDFISDDLYECEKLYSRFVYDAYTRVPDDKFSRLKADISGREDFSVLSKIGFVRSYLNEHAEYSLSPGKTPVGKDFIEYFLYENHKGYCTYFASSSVIMLRLMGVPARYVEGYVIRPDDFPKGNISGSQEVKIKDNRAHAWTEIYIDGIGWMPVDFTPGIAFLPNTETGEPETSAAESSAQVTTITEDVSYSEEVTSKPNESTNVTEIKPENSTVVSGSNQNGTTKPEVTEGAPKSIFKWVYWIVIILAIFCFILMRHTNTVRKRCESFRTGISKNNIINMYRYLEKLFKYLGIENIDKLAVSEYSDYVLKVMSEKLFKSAPDRKIMFRDKFRSNEVSLQKMMEISYEAGFSAHEMTDMAEKIVKNTVDAILDEIYNSLSKPQRIIFVYILNLK